MRPSTSPVQSLVRSLSELLASAVGSARLSREAKSLAEELRVHFDWVDSLLHAAYTARDAGGAFVIQDNELRIAIKTSAELISDWTEVVRSICDSTTTRVPYHMGEWLAEELSLIQAPSHQEKDLRRRIALCPTTDLNYYHTNAALVRQDLQHLQDQHRQYFHQVFQHAVPSSPPAVSADLPTTIRFHYSLPNDLLLNPILFHELGHHVWQSLDPLAGKRAEIGKAVFDALNTWPWFQAEFPKELAAKHYNGNAHRVLIYYKRTFFSWVQELFCDAFAVAVIGPQFVLATDSLFRFLKANAWTFGLSHPADVYRARRSWELLETIGWTRKGSDSFSVMAINVIESSRPSPKSAGDAWKDVISEKLQKEPALKAHSVPDGLLKPILDRFAPDIDAAALKIVGNATARADEFWKLGPLIADLLNNAIVPSTVVMPATGESCTVTANPLPSTVTNVARILIETGCPELLNNWRASGHEHEFQRVRTVEERLAEWTIKGVADSNLLARWSRIGQT